MRNRRSALKFHCALFIAAAVAASLHSFPATAASAGITIAPQQFSGGEYRAVSYFKLHLAAGRMVGVGRIGIANASRTQAARVRIDPVDAQTAQNLGSAYRIPGLKIRGQTRWIQLSARRVTVPPRRRIYVGVTVRVPSNAKSGDYLSGLSVEALGQSSTGNPGPNVAIAITRRFALGVLTTIPGPRHSLIEFHGAQVVYDPHGLAFRLNAANQGNTILRNVEGSATVSRGGARILSVRIPPGTFLPGTSIQYPMPAKSERPREGTVYRVKAIMRYRGGAARLDQKVRFGHEDAVKQQEFLGPSAPAPSHKGLPVWAFLAVAALLASGAIAYLVYRRHRRRPLKREAGLTMLSEELSSIAGAGQPVSVIVVGGIPLDKASRKTAIDKLRGRLRATDVLCELSPAELLVISRDTGAQAAAGLVEDIQRNFALSNGRGSWMPVLRSITAEQATTAAEVFAQMAAADSEGSRTPPEVPKYSS